MIDPFNPFNANIRDLDELFVVDGDQSKPLRDWTADDFTTWADVEEDRGRSLGNRARDRATAMVAKMARADAATVGEMVQHEGRTPTTKGVPA